MLRLNILQYSSVMESSNRLYGPRPMDASKRQIRLIYIQPARSFEDPVVCELKCCCLTDTELQYTTLSYCWGQPAFDSTLICNNIAVHITANLHYALRRVRQASFGLPIWVDQICIDQSNLQERSEQIQIMISIYRGSKRLFIYIGEEDGTTDAAFGFLQQMLQELTTHDGFLGLDVPGNIIDFNDQLRASLSFMDLILRDWFSRVWVLQEVYVSHDPIVICGSKKLLWSSIGDVLEHIVKNAGRQNPVIRKTQLLYDIAMYWPYDHGPDDRFPLIYLLQVARSFQASDPRDKIYALLGLASDCTEFPAPEYSLSVEKVYKDTAEILYSQGWGLGCLMQAGLHQQSSRNMPSWVPDWSSASDRQAWVPNIYPEGASQCTRYIQLASRKADTLSLIGRRLGKVTACASQSPPSTRWSDRCLCVLESAIGMLASTSQTLDPYDDIVLQSLCNLLRNDGTNGIKNLSNRDPDLLKRLLIDLGKGLGSMAEFGEIILGSNTESSIIHDFQESNEYSGFYITILSALSHINVALTLSAIPSLVPPLTREDDVVFLVKNATAPIILRPTDAGAYYLVGIAYVRGLLCDQRTGSPDSGIDTIMLI